MTRKEITDLFVRFLITFCLMLPFFIGIGFLLQDKVSDFVMVTIFVVLCGIVLSIEEYIHYKNFQKRKLLKEIDMKEKEMERLNGK